MLANALLHTHITKAESMPIFPVNYIFFYFINKCDGLAKITARLVFLGWLKVVKSLTITAMGASIRANPSFVGNSEKTLKVKPSG
jgi:hypothetical protein